jgi:hypothetical protein
LLGRHVGEGAGNDFRRRRSLTLTWKPGSKPETGQADVASVIDEHVRRLDVFVYEAVPMDLDESFRQANGDAQGARQIERLMVIPHKVSLKNPIQGLTARVREYEDRPPFVTSDRKRLGCPCRIEFDCERVFVFEPQGTLRERLLRVDCQRQER